MVLETEATDKAIKPYINKNVDINNFVEATYETEELSDFGVNIKIDKDDVDDERILGKVFDTPDDAYTFYNDYSFLHGFGIRRDDTIKNPNTNEPFRKIYVCNKEGFKRMDKNDSSENEKKRHRDVRTGCQAMLRITRQEDGKW
ncbi:protein FAR1-RELATED SEQUENCE 5-like [Lactuca sativa]|uniref:protein FAR1-RELATED SEQUENCE 5-like n=1 Tax=Lactuca sativa TaxID=4236 RepID=UPI0022B03DDC|nr:protein FAR1-RELATED SEQUENCE 5-like [Lactuca sativa]